MGRPRKPPAPAVRNRVRGIAELPAARVEPSPGNARTHGAEQRNAALGLLGAVGSVSELVAWIPDDAERARLGRMPGPDGFAVWLASFGGVVRLLDGHMRRDLRGALVGVQITDLDAREAALVLATFDPLGAMAGRDDALMAALRAEVGARPDDDALAASILGSGVTGGDAPPKPDRSRIVEALDAEDAPTFPDAQSPSVEDVLAGRARWAVVEGEALALLASLPDASVDALITDPPYSSGGQFRGDRTRSTTTKYVQSGQKKKRAAFSGDNRDQRSFVAWCAMWLTEASRVLRVGAPVCLFTDWRQLPATTDAMQAGGFVWRGVAPWDKGEGTRPVLGRFRAQAEYVVWGSNGPMATGRPVPVLPGARTIAVKQDDKFHETGKPTAVMRWINAICEPGGIILDPFFGSGSTGAAALLDGYRVIGCEKTEAYAPISRGRLAFVERGLAGAG